MALIVVLVISEFLLLLLLCTEALQCYDCTSSLPANISKDAQRAFKAVLYSTFVVPPVDRLCVDSNDVEFRTVKQTNCSTNDQCVKITVQQKDLKFVMRGCERHIYRSKLIGNNVKCRHDQSPSICRCSGNLCNRALIFSPHSCYIFSLIFLRILQNFV